MTKELPHLVKSMGKQFLKRAIDKVFPPDNPLSQHDQGKRYGIVNGDNQFSLYWGDLHGHSNLSAEAVGSPDDFYEYARHQRLLDFTALTDHDFSINDDKWLLIQAKAAQYNEPGRFVTFVAYEWTSHFGHKVVLFPADLVPEKIMVRSRKKKDNPYALWSFLKPWGAITIPHHTFSLQVSTNWFYKNNEQQPLVEIYSKHGSCEEPNSPPVVFKMALEKNRSVVDALNRGHRLGFIGCSDTHCSKPGSEKSMELLTHRLVLKYKSGLTGVYARSLTREGIWRALLARRTFATTGVRLFVDFRVGEHLMGEEFSTSDRQMMSVWIDSPEAIASVDIIKNGKLFLTRTPHRTTEHFTAWDDEPREGDCYYYMRVTLESGNRAWCSPIWVHYI